MPLTDEPPLLNGRVETDEWTGAQTVVYAYGTAEEMFLLLEHDSDKTILKWAGTFLKQNYTTVGLIDSFSADNYQIYWDEEARRNKPLSEDYLFVVKRNIK